MDAAAAVDQLEALYEQAIDFLCSAFALALQNGAPDGRGARVLP